MLLIMTIRSQRLVSNRWGPKSSLRRLMICKLHFGPSRTPTWFHCCCSKRDNFNGDKTLQRRQWLPLFRLRLSTISPKTNNIANAKITVTPRHAWGIRCTWVLLEFWKCSTLKYAVFFLFQKIIRSSILKPMITTIQCSFAF